MGWGDFQFGYRLVPRRPNQFRLRMQLLQWHWKLTGIDLPEKLRDEIAGETGKEISLT